jgi:hypothetical protein
MEADLDLADQLKPADQELFGDDLMLANYGPSMPTVQTQKPYNNALYATSINDFKSKSIIDSVLHRPTTPGQLRQSIAAHTVDSLANSLATGDMFASLNNFLEYSQSFKTKPMGLASSFGSKKSHSASIASPVKSKASTKVSATSMLIHQSKSNRRMSSIDPQKQRTPVLAFNSNDHLDRCVPNGTPLKATPPMKFSFAEPPRSNSSVSMRSSSSSTLDSSHGNQNNSKTNKT